MTMKRVLLTGAAGFLGSHALKLILDRTDWHVVCPVSFRHKGMPERLVEVVGSPARWSRVTSVMCDLSAPAGPLTRRAIGHVNLILNYASESHVDRSIEDPATFVRNNVDVVLELLEFARDQDQLEAFVQVSTDEVYGPAALDHRHAEWESIIPSNPYSASKAAQEAIAISYWRTYGVPVVITNAMNLIGEYQDAEKFVPMAVNRIINGEEVPVHANLTAGTVGSRFYLHAENMADALLFLVQNTTPASYAGGADRPDRYHIVGEREVTNSDMVYLIAELLHKYPRVKLVDFHSSRPGHDLRYALDGSKIAALGWKAPISFEESLRRAVVWAAEHPHWA